MRKHKRGMRLTSLVLAMVMAMSVLPWTSLKTSALTVVNQVNYTDFNFEDTVNLPIKIYEYDADGMLFEYLSDGDGDGSYLRDANGQMTKDPAKVDNAKTLQTLQTIFGSRWVDYNIYINGGGLGNNMYNYCKAEGGSNAHLSAVLYGRDNDGQYVRYSSKAGADVNGRDWSVLGDFKNPADNTMQWVPIEEVRYFVMSYRCTTSDRSSQTGEEWAAVGLSTAKASDPGGMEAEGVFSGWTFLKEDTKNWNYIIIDLQSGAPGQKGITAKELQTLYLRFPTFTEGDYIDIGGFGFFPNYQTAERFGVYSASTGTYSDVYDKNNTAKTGYSYSSNRGLGFTNSDTAAFGTVAQRIDVWQKNRGWAEYVTYFDGNGTKVFAEDTDPNLGYDLFQTIRTNSAAVGLLEGSLGVDGVPAYKQETVAYVARFLLNAMEQKSKHDNEGWLNHTYIRGSSYLFSVDSNGNGQIDANEQTDLASAIGALCGTDPSVSYHTNGNKVTGREGTYAATMAYIEEYRKANNGKNPLIGSWNDCKNHIDSYYDAAYYLLHNLFVGNSYNVEQDTYNYLILPSATDQSTGHKTYVFDAGFAYQTGSGNATTNNTKSAVVYNQDGTIRISDQVKTKAMDESGNSLYPFLPVHGVAGDNSSQPPSTLVYYAQSAVSNTDSYGATYYQRGYHYTLTSQGTFFYDPEAEYYFDFSGDDDVYLFINGELVMDIGGAHGMTDSHIELNEYVQWAQKVLKSADSKYTEEDRARARKLNLIEGQSYTFDFYYMERHGTGANMRISTNIPVSDPNMGVQKRAYQNGVEIPKGGAAADGELVEYAFSLTNGTVDKLYNLSFHDSNLNLTLNTSDKPFTAGIALNSGGEALSVTDLVAYVDGITPEGEKTETIQVTFKNETELRNFLMNLSAKGTQSGVGDVPGFSGDGLWKAATVTIRGIYYKLPLDPDRNIFTNTVSVTANHSTGLRFFGADTHRFFTAMDPAFYMWAGHTLRITKDEIHGGVIRSTSIKEEEKVNLPNLGSIQFDLVDRNGTPYQYDNISLMGHKTVVSLNYSEPGAHLFYLRAYDADVPSREMIIPVAIYVLQPDHDYFVLDYGLSSVLTDGTELINDPFLKTSGSNTTVSIMGFASEAKYKASISYREKEINTALPAAGSYDTATGYLDEAYYTIEQSVTLSHSKPWVMEFVAKGVFDGEVLLAKHADHSVQGNQFLGFYTDTIALCEKAANNVTMGSGISWQTVANKLNSFYGKSYTAQSVQKEPHIYRFINRPTTDGKKNVVYLYVDGIEIGPMNQCSNSASYAPSVDLRGKDFTFHYVGCQTNTLDNCAITYLKIWEEGDNTSVSRWRPVNGVLTSDHIENFEKNVATKISGTTENGKLTAHQYQLDKPIVLQPDKEWKISWRASIKSASFLLSGSVEAHASNTSIDGDECNVYLWTDAGDGDLLFGYFQRTKLNTNGTVGGVYYQVGRNVGISNLSSGSHVITLENRIRNGTNMVYVFVDGREMGAMDQAYMNGNPYPEGNANWISGKTLMFNYFGASRSDRALNGTYTYIEVDTGLEKSQPTLYWQFDKTASGGYADELSGANGNRLDVDDQNKEYTATEHMDMTIDYEEKKLTVTPQTMGAWEDSVYVMMSVHKAGYEPTALGPAEDDAYNIDISKEAQMVKKITVIPANVVYFEDDFPAINYVENTANTITKLGSGSQDLYQSTDQSTNYGSDQVYQDSMDSTISGNSAHKLEITVQGTLAYFTFTGTGMELVARTNAVDSGSIYLMIYENGEGITLNEDGTVTGADPIAYVPVITKFDNDNDLGAEGIYQVPIIRWESGLDEAREYIVLIKAVPPYGVTTKQYLYLDGIRVFQPLGENNEHYNAVENGVSFVEIRDKIIEGYVAAAEFDGANVTVGVGTLTWTENHNNTTANGTEYVGNKVTSVNDYLMMGPNNEVYMDGSFTHSALVFYVKESAAPAHDLQIGVRAMDYGAFVGAGRTYENIRLQYGIEVQGTYQWVDFATSSTSTEQYFSIPYGECPMVGEYYQVMVRVDAVNSYTPAFASFTSLKLTGLVLKEVSGELRSVEYREGKLTDTQTGELVTGNNFIAFETVSAQLRSDEVYNIYAGVPDDDFAQVDPQGQIVPKYPSLSFEDEVYYDVHFTVNGLDGISAQDMGLITFDTEQTNGTVDSAKDMIPGAVVMNGNYVVRTKGIPAMKMGDTLWFKIYVKQADGSYLYSKLLSYSGLTYANNILAKPENADVHPLLVAMLNYGAAAQEYFGYRTEQLMNAGLTDGQKALVTGYQAEMIDPLLRVDAAKSGSFAQTPGGFLKKSPAVSFEGAFAINYFMTPAHPVEGNMTMYYWTQEDLQKADVLKVENATGALTMQEALGTYSASVVGLAAKQIDETVAVACVYQSGGVTYSTGVLTYSLGTYCQNIARNDASGAQALAAATAVYGYYAENYFQS